MGNLMSIWQIEKSCWNIFSQLLARNLRYAVVILPMYARSVHSPIRCHYLRASYCFARYLDDVLDGDIEISVNSREYVNHLLEKVKNGHSPDGDVYSRLGRYVYQHINRYANHDTIPTEELDKLIEAMVFDRRRADERIILPRQILDQHHQRTFMSSLYVTLDIAGAKYQPEDVRPLARAQGIFYSLRDLKKDVTSGIQNIPEEVLNATDLSEVDYWSFDSVINTSEIKKWMEEEFQRGSLQLRKVWEKLNLNRNFKFRATVKPLYRGLYLLRKKLGKQYELI